jgi:hypothetical protein
MEEAQQQELQEEKRSYLSHDPLLSLSLSEEENLSAIFYRIKGRNIAWLKGCGP